MASAVSGGSATQVASAGFPRIANELLDVTPAQDLPWNGSFFSRPKKPSHAALSGEQPFLGIERVILAV